MSFEREKVQPGSCFSFAAKLPPQMKRLPPLWLPIRQRRGPVSRFCPSGARPRITYSLTSSHRRKAAVPSAALGVSANKHQSRATVEVTRVEQKSETATAE